MSAKNRRMMLIWNAKLSRPSGSLVFLMECPRSFLSLLISLDVRPLFFVGAENDQTLRHLVAEKFGFRLDGKWKKHSSGMCSIYLNDVKKLFANNCQLFSEIIALLVQNVSGSLLPDRLARISHLLAFLVDCWAFVDHNLHSSFMFISPSGISKRITLRDMFGS